MIKKAKCLKDKAMEEILSYIFFIQFLWIHLYSQHVRKSVSNQTVDRRQN